MLSNSCGAGSDFDEIIVWLGSNRCDYATDNLLIYQKVLPKSLSRLMLYTH
jgi:hypothetical protein